MKKFSLNEFECISDKYIKDLKAKFNITTVDQFYKYSRQQLLTGLDVEAKVLDQWISVMDLFKIPKMTARNAELLYYANINSVEELAHRDAARIYYKLRQLDKETYLIILNYVSYYKAN